MQNRAIFDQIWKNSAPQRVKDTQKHPHLTFKIFDDASKKNLTQLRNKLLEEKVIREDAIIGATARGQVIRGLFPPRISYV